jgi:hypothetical protein
MNKIAFLTREEKKRKKNRLKPVREGKSYLKKA